MARRLQSRIAGSKLALPVVSVYTIGIWLLAGLLSHQWWLQFGLFVLATFLMMQLNNLNSLVRIYSRMVSCTFLALMCCASFLFPSVPGTFMQTCFIGALLVLFTSYQDKQSTGTMYYAWLLIGMASLSFVQVLYYLPLLWLLTATTLQSLTWKSWGASLLGLLTPYWVAVCWLTVQGDFSPLVSHFAGLADFSMPFQTLTLTDGQTATAALVVLMALTGTIHYMRQYHDDRIRTRLIYSFFIWTGIFTLVFLLLQPQHYDFLMRILIVCTAPLMGHFLALTSTKITQAAFFFYIGVTLMITGYNLWMS